jgi:hypothetical protein
MRVIIRPGFHRPTTLRIGSVDSGYAARALARFAAIHSAERPLDGACANASSVRVPAIVPDQRTNAAKGKREVRVSLGAPAHKRPERARRVTLKPAPAGEGPPR